LPESEPGRPTNRLAGETSAYLRQHMHNPVDWHPWGDEAFERARREDKPLLVSIGYSACHWCHVMEHESFEDECTAKLMNAHFVPVKVDREERPDVDSIYMEALQRLTGHGGWPLTAFCTPDGRPFYAGTYFPPEPRHGLPSFRQLLEAVARTYASERERVERSADQITAALAERPRGVADAPPGPHTAAEAARQLLRGADRQHGGFGGAPKFPTPPSLELLLAASDVLPAEEARDAREHVAFTCREMARGGVYDQLGGGFHRYSVDERWAVPHFEKMLYDQGQLLRVYAEAHRRTGDPDLLWPVRETADYLAREMTGPEGGFFASQDADSEGFEGRFYVFTPEQVDAVLGAERGRAFCRAYGVAPGGNFEGGTSVLADRARLPREDFEACRAELLAARSRRVAPDTDTKRVAAWNGMAIGGLAHAAAASGDDELLGMACRAADFVWERMRDDRGRLLRVHGDGRAKIPAFLDDHAALLAGLLDLHRAGGGERYLPAALEIAGHVARRFWDEDEGELFLTPSDGERLVHRPRAEPDGATPSSGGWAALGLLRAAALAGRDDLHRIAARVVRGHAFELSRVPHAFPTLARAALVQERGVTVAVVVGEPDAADTRALAARARRALGPEDAVVVAASGAAPPGLDPTWLAGRGPQGGRATAFVCRGTECSLPVTDPEALAPLPEPAAGAP